MPPATPAPTSDPAVAAVLAWWDAERRELPWRRTRDPYAVWVSETMSQQTRVTRVVERWTAWMERWPSVEALAAAELGDVLRAWDGLGYPRRARDLHAAAGLVAAGGWPEDLTALPGVGPYTAAAIRCFAFEEPVLPPDVNVSRVLARRFPHGVDPSGDPWRAGQALMEFGQRVCAARPRCAECPVADGCPGRDAPTDPAPRKRRQAAYDGSLRQRRGTVLRTVLAAGAVPLAAVDDEAAAGLVADGLLRRDGAHLRAP